MLYKEKSFLNFLRNYEIKDIRSIEENEDSQYKALRNAWQKINEKKETDLVNFITAIIKNSVISYQLSWDWEKWWWEFSSYIEKHPKLIYENTQQQREKFLKTCKYNSRLLNVKLERLKKIDNIRQHIDTKEKIVYYYENMEELNQLIADIMKQKRHKKTVVFTTKVFWYWARICLERFISFPFSVGIPIDSRLSKIFLHIKWAENIKEEKIREYFEERAAEHQIPPLHLDSLLWIRYRKNIKSQL